MHPCRSDTYSIPEENTYLVNCIEEPKLILDFGVSLLYIGVAQSQVHTLKSAT